MTTKVVTYCVAKPDPTGAPEIPLPDAAMFLTKCGGIWVADGTEGGLLGAMDVFCTAGGMVFFRVAADANGKLRWNAHSDLAPFVAMAVDGISRPVIAVRMMSCANGRWRPHAQAVVYNVYPANTFLERIWNRPEGVLVAQTQFADEQRAARIHK